MMWSLGGETLGLVPELRDLFCVGGKRSAGQELARCLCGRALELRESRPGAPSRVCAAPGSACGAQRSGSGLPGSRRTLRSHGRDPTCRGTSSLLKGFAGSPSGRAGACVTPGCLSQCESLLCETRSEPSCPCGKQHAGLGALSSQGFFAPFLL